MLLMPSLDDLTDRVLRTEGAWESIEHFTYSEFIQDLKFIESAGFDATKLQWLIGKPFSKFREEDQGVCRVIAKGMREGKFKARDLEEVLFHQEVRSRSMGQTVIFETDDLLSLESIAGYLGIKNPIRGRG
jgi:hypothetical protein